VYYSSPDESAVGLLPHDLCLKLQITQIILNVFSSTFHKRFVNTQNIYVITVTINTTKQPQYLPKISDVYATTVAFFELITLR